MSASNDTIRLLRNNQADYDRYFSQFDNYSPFNVSAFRIILSEAGNGLGITLEEMANDLGIPAPRLELINTNAYVSTAEERELIRDYAFQRLTGTWQPPNA